MCGIWSSAGAANGVNRTFGVTPRARTSASNCVVTNETSIVFSAPGARLTNTIPSERPDSTPLPIEVRTPSIDAETIEPPIGAANTTCDRIVPADAPPLTYAGRPAASAGTVDLRVTRT